MAGNWLKGGVIEGLLEREPFLTRPFSPTRRITLRERCYQYRRHTVWACREMESPIKLIETLADLPGTVSGA